MAFVARETKRGSGKATVLLCQMMKIAQKRRLVKMLAYVRRDNQAMLHIFENYDFVRQPSDSLEEVVLWRILKSTCLLYTSPSPRDDELSRMPSSA